MKFTVEKIRELVAKKNVYIFAVNLEGVGYSKLFTRLGFDVRGFLDSRKVEKKKLLSSPSPKHFF